MQAPVLLQQAERGHKPYRLRCRFQIDPHPSQRRLDIEKVRIAERFVSDMRKHGWVHDGHWAFRMTGPYPKISPSPTIVPKRMLSARQMLAGVKEGMRFRDDGFKGAQAMPLLGTSDWWEFELSSVFVRPEIRVEIPKLHEEEGNN